MPQEKSSVYLGTVMRAVMSTLKNSALPFLLSLLMLCCDILNPPIPDEPATILYTVSGGIGGGIQKKVSISPAGVARLETTYPILELQLSDQDQKSLRETFSGFKFLPEDFPTQCIDDLFFTIERNGSDYSKRVSIGGCPLSDKKDTDPAVKKLNALVSILEKIAKNIYDTKAPWLGLTVEFAIDKEVYGLGEPMTLRYRISNPTTLERGIYFKHQSQLWFMLYKTNVPSFHYSFPNLLAPDSSSPSEIILQPGTTKELVYVWDQSIISSQGEKSALDVGSYRIVMNLLAGNFQYQAFGFEVVDKSVPIGGVIIPDWNGESSSSPTYTFTLWIRNWTSNSLTLHFPSTEKIFVELYDLDKPTAGPLLYQGPVKRDSTASEIVLGPGESRTFTHVAQKSEFSTWYMWTYAEIRLLCSDFTFSRDGQLRILKYR